MDRIVVPMPYAGPGDVEGLYAVLGVPPGVSADGIRRAVRRESKVWRAQRRHDSSAVQRLAWIRRARTVLLNASKRAEYDRRSEHWFEEWMGQRWHTTPESARKVQQQQVLQSQPTTSHQEWTSGRSRWCRIGTVLLPLTLWLVWATADINAESGVAPGWVVDVAWGFVGVVGALALVLAVASRWFSRGGCRLRRAATWVASFGALGFALFIAAGA